MSKVVLAVAAHPDDIEFMMAGALLLLAKAGYELHHMNVANGSCGSVAMNKDQTVAVRTQEARNAADCLAAKFHPPLVNDLKIYYCPELAARLCAIVRRVNPEILLIPSIQDYMEDHTNVSRLMVTSAFCRNMLNFETDPPSNPIQSEMALYHALPYGLQDQLRKPVKADLYVDVTSTMDKKREALGLDEMMYEQALPVAES